MINAEVALRAVFFDLDGVVRQWDMRQVVRAETAAGLPEGGFFKVAFDPKLVGQAVTGRITDEQWRAAVDGRLRELYPDGDVDTAMQLWEEAPSEVDADVLELVRACRRQVSVGLITNATSRLPADLKQLQLTDEFDHVFNTSELGVAKPDAEVFRIALEEVGVDPAESFFVDDSEANVEAAAAFGMHAHHFTDADTLRGVLRDLGLDM